MKEELSPFQIEVNEIFERMKKEGVEKVAREKGFKMTKEGRLDKRTKYGRVLQPMLDDLN